MTWTHQVYISIYDPGNLGETSKDLGPPSLPFDLPTYSLRGSLQGLGPTKSLLQIYDPGNLGETSKDLDPPSLHLNDLVPTKSSRIDKIGDWGEASKDLDPPSLHFNFWTCLIKGNFVQFGPAKPLFQLMKWDTSKDLDPPSLHFEPVAWGGDKQVFACQTCFDMFRLNLNSNCQNTPGLCFHYLQWGKPQRIEQCPGLSWLKWLGPTKSSKKMHHRFGSTNWLTIMISRCFKWLGPSLPRNCITGLDPPIDWRSWYLDLECRRKLNCSFLPQKQHATSRIHFAFHGRFVSGLHIDMQANWCIQVEVIFLLCLALDVFKCKCFSCCVCCIVFATSWHHASNLGVTICLWFCGMASQRSVWT